MDGCKTGGCGSCGGCGGCSGREVVLTPGELELLGRFARLAFLPVARRSGDETPVYLEDGPSAAPSRAAELTALRLKGLISLDYDLPLSNFDYAAYEGSPVRGSMALTAAGQAVVELLDVRGTEV